MKKLYVFQCKGNEKIMGFSPKDTGEDIPLKYCGSGWEFIKEIEISRESPGLMGAPANDILNGIETNGYYIAGYEINFHEGTLKNQN